MVPNVTLLVAQYQTVLSNAQLPASVSPRVTTASNDVTDDEVPFFSRFDRDF